MNDPPMPSNALTTRPPGGGGSPSESQIIGLLSRPDIKAQMALALPKHVTAERLARIALTEVRKNPKLLNCDQVSFMGAIMQCCQLGLEPGGPLGHAFLIPFENRRKGIVECQFMIGYRGMLDLAGRSGRVKVRPARIVREGDEFSYCYGLKEDLQHVVRSSTGPMTHVYMVADLEGGGQMFEVMNREEVEDIRDNSQGYKSALKYDKKDNPWMTNFDGMAKKTVARRLFKWLPVSIELATAVSLDEQADHGHQENPLAHLTSAAPEAPALPASVTAPVALLSEQQIVTIRTAMDRRLNAVGIETMARYGGPLEETPADQFSEVMATLANDAAVDAMNRGASPTPDGMMLLSEAEIEAIIAATVESASEPDPEPAPIRRRVGQGAA